MDLQKYQSNDEIAWCPGCGNFALLGSVKKALAALELAPKDVLLVSGIGQAAKLPHYLRCNCFNGLHGRALPVAAGAKMANRALTVLVTTGDGDCYGEGGNHFLHNIRRNIDLTVVVHNNQIYGLTKGQASPTTDRGFVTKVQTQGVLLEPFHALAVAIAAGAGFVARGFVRDTERVAELITAAIRHQGFSLVEVLQPCVSFNPKNTYEWYAERVCDIDQDKSYDRRDKISALEKSLEWGERIPTGILYYDREKTYEDRSGLSVRPPLVEENLGFEDVMREFM
ncbi:MAG: 2-oxoacid ferredoxin oxidoreductase [Candidatus Omnitrophica bacterium]|nr:2-oxoacid ferredoxin oxidoreductase [Candidatus Omnitrophota bacterium]